MASSCNGCFGGLVFPDFVQQRCCNRYFQFERQFRLRMQPLLRLSRYAAGRSTIRWGGPLFSALYK